MHLPKPALVVRFFLLFFLSMNMWDSYSVLTKSTLWRGLTHGTLKLTVDAL